MDAPLYSRDGTSYDAALSIEEQRLPLREQVYLYIERVGGATDAEICRGLHMSDNTARPRRYELEHAKRIIDSGEKRKTPSGRWAIVWSLPKQPRLL